MRSYPEPEPAEETNADSGESLGDPIPEAFPPDNAAARFVVSMSMAKNDIDRALRDVVRAFEDDTPDFSYRVRILTGHLLEAIVAFNAYTNAFVEVRDLNKRLPSEAEDHLRRVRGSLQRVGKHVLERARNNTFHYPAPNTGFTPSSDEELAVVLATMNGRGTEIHFDGDTQAVTLDVRRRCCPRACDGQGRHLR